MTEIKIKPLSVNRAWQGKRYKSKEYLNYEKLVLLLLPKKLNIPDGLLRLDYDFGFSNFASDADNAVKPFQDLLQKKYGFNDNRIAEIFIRKIKVKKGEEYIRFDIKPLF